MSSEKETSGQQKMFSVSVKHSPHGTLLVITDREILGKVFEEGRIQLDMRKKFYLGEHMSKEKVKELLKSARHIHLTGKHSVAVGIELEVINNDKILWVKGIPHAEGVLE